MHDEPILMKGKGNAEWKYSVPHGVGRAMTRSRTREALNVDAYREARVDIFSMSICESLFD